MGSSTEQKLRSHGGSGRPGAMNGVAVSRTKLSSTQSSVRTRIRGGMAFTGVPFRCLGEGS